MEEPFQPHLDQFFSLRCTQMLDDEINMPRKFEEKLTSIKLCKGRCSKALDDFADFSVFRQVGRYVCVLLLISDEFSVFGIFPFDRTSFFTFIIPGSRDIVQVVQIVQIDLQKFCFTAPGSNLAFVFKNIAHNF